MSEIGHSLTPPVKPNTLVGGERRIKTAVRALTIGSLGLTAAVKFADALRLAWNWIADALSVLM